MEGALDEGGIGDVSASVREESGGDTSAEKDWSWDASLWWRVAGARSVSSFILGVGEVVISWISSSAASAWSGTGGSGWAWDAVVVGGLSWSCKMPRAKEVLSISCCSWIVASSGGVCSEVSTC